jgi:hypothetical protein
VKQVRNRAHLLADLFYKYVAAVGEQGGCPRKLFNIDSYSGKVHRDAYQELTNTVV